MCTFPSRHGSWSGLWALVSCVGVDAAVKTLKLRSSATSVPELDWGKVPVILHGLLSKKRKAVVVQCRRTAVARTGWVLSRYGCHRLAWDSLNSNGDWPKLEVVEVSSIFSEEQAHPDRWDL